MTRTTVYPARRILTMNPTQPEATHVAVRDGRILAVGDAARMAAWGPFTLDQRFADFVLMPGFVEGHCHLKEGGMWDRPYLGWFDRQDPDGRVWPGTRTLDAVVQRLSALDAEMRSAGQPADAPLIVWGFDPIYFSGERMSALHLDAVGHPSSSLSGQAQRPIVIAHANGHLLTVNNVMLRATGITAETEVEGVMKFESGPLAGQPNGELQEPAAMYLVLRQIGPAGLLAPMNDVGMHNFGRIACLHGVTTATDLVNRLGEAELAVLEKHCNQADYPVRIVPAFQAFHGSHGAAQGAEYLRTLAGRSTDRLRLGLVKMMLDGSIQGFSGRLRWPGYFKHPNASAQSASSDNLNDTHKGIWVTSPAQFEADFETYHRAGLQIHTHTNGDEASEVAINAIERVLARAPRPDHRHTLQHGQMIDAALFRRMAALGLCANLFSNHLWYWGDQHHDITMGPDRAHRLNACRSALDAGVALAIHSDAPVTPLAPLFTAWCAVNRLTPSGRVLGAAEALTVPEALRAITLGAAWTLKLDAEIGSIECGKRADFAVLRDDPLALPPAQLKDVRVWGTVLSGRVFEAGSPASAPAAAH